LAATILVAVSATSFAQSSQQPAPSAGKISQPEQAQPQSTQQAPPADERGTDKSPIAVKVLPAPDAEEEATERQEDRREKAANDRKIIILTKQIAKFNKFLVIVGAAQSVVFLIQLLVFSRQAQRLRQTVDLATEQAPLTARAAEAAEASASVADEALRTTQRAYIAVKPVGIGPFSKSWIPGSAVELVGRVRIYNVGTLPARNVRWSIKITCERSEEWGPPKAVNFIGDNVVPRGIEMEEASNKISSGEVIQLKNAASGGYCYVWGSVSYRDGFNQQRFTDFCHRYNCDSMATLVRCSLSIRCQAQPMCSYISHANAIS
jgi:hypothetical protein